ncbi:hypothetical protein GPJ56_007746 [Histomonas meleagridis]|uniref:uncharacterized protein n=1 Tax=Histomonas meleagridis TaxID=135588 RepID=UPI003559E902|nr:hypothetical protein GPJ56_007746 [Histomonas meleagridis]KAH0798776.1 hypothetical protein GO595_008641 [Histomonas meleagridis]
MTNRGKIISETASLLSQVKSLELKRDTIREQIQRCKEIIEKQKHEASTLSLLISSTSVPPLKETTEKISFLKQQISKHQKLHETLQNQLNELRRATDEAIYLRDQKKEYDKLLAEYKNLSKEYDKEKQRENELKIQSSRLSSAILKLELSKKQIEAKCIEYESSEKIDLNSLHKKNHSLSEQARLLKAKRELFEQEIELSKQNLLVSREKRQKVEALIEKSNSIDIDSLREQLLDMASINLELHKIEPLDNKTSQKMKEIKSLVDSCESLINFAGSVVDVI